MPPSGSGWQALRPCRELRRAWDSAVLDVRDAIIEEHIAVTVGDAEGIGSRSHARIGLDKVVI